MGSRKDASNRASTEKRKLPGGCSSPRGNCFLAAAGFDSHFFLARLESSLLLVLAMSLINTFFSRRKPDDNTGANVQVAQYSADDVLGQFLALFKDLDFNSEIRELGIGTGRFQRALRKQAELEFRALTVALWEVALRKSFPEDAARLFQQFRTEFLPTMEAEDVLLDFRDNIDNYARMLQKKGDSDFFPVAERLADRLALATDTPRKLHLKLSLMIRNLYTLIFTKLV